MFFQINLPDPNQEIIQLCLKHSENFGVNYGGLQYIVENAPFYKNYNIASGTFKVIEEINNLVQLQYKNFFSDKFVATLGVLDNLKRDSLSIYPPHTDRQRNFTINYYIETGGENVRTILYDKYEKFENTFGSSLLPETELKKVSDKNLCKNKWYCFNSRQFHSVKNIETKRIMLGLSFCFEYFDDFIKKYYTIDNKS